MKAVLLGSGNVAFHIAPALQRAGVEWVQVYSRNLLHAQEMAQHIGLSACTDRFDQISHEADLYVLAVHDEAVADLADVLRLPGKTVVHVSGSLPCAALRPISEHQGVLYFFQTFSKQAPSPDLRHTPILVEASDEATACLLKGLAERISDKVCLCDRAQREWLHIGGVLVNNYVNLLYTAASDLLKEAGLDFSLLHPIMEQTLQKAFRMPPDEAQTGPALRGDEAVVQSHLRRLAGAAQGQQYTEMYRFLAQEIKNRFKNRPNVKL